MRPSASLRLGRGSPGRAVCWVLSPRKPGTGSLGIWSLETRRKEERKVSSLSSIFPTVLSFAYSEVTHRAHLMQLSFKVWPEALVSSGSWLEMQSCGPIAGPIQSESACS